MALQTLEGAGLWVPTSIAYDPQIGNNVFIIDASGEKAVCVLVCPRAGVLDRFDANVATVTNSPDNGLRFSFQNVDASTGQNTGTILGATNNASTLYAHTVTTGWKSTNFTETVTVTRGQMIACVVDFPTFVASDSVTMSHHAVAGATLGFPYGISATSTKGGVNIPAMALHYTDGYGYISDFVPGADTAPNMTYNSSTAIADEWGMGFQVPFPCVLDRFSARVGLGAGTAVEGLVYNAGSTVLSTVALDGDQTHSAANGLYDFVLPTALTLTANTTYRVSVRPTTTSGIILRYWTFQSAALMQGTIAGGDNFYMTSRLDQTGSWTDYNTGTFRRPLMALHITALDDGVGGGGGGGGNFGMVGG